MIFLVVISKQPGGKIECVVNRVFLDVEMTRSCHYHPSFSLVQIIWLAVQARKNELQLELQGSIKSHRKVNNMIAACDLDQ